MPLTEVFAALGLRRPGSTAIDVDALPAVVPPPRPTTAGALADAVSGVCLAAIAFGDPQLLVLGGPWGRLPAFVELIRGGPTAGRAPGPHRGLARSEGSPELVGARLRAVELLRSAIVQDSRQRPPAP